MEPKEDDELSIDFSEIGNKIKNFFKSDKKAEDEKFESAKEEPLKIAKEEKEDDELSIDFSKIKKFFTSEKGVGSTEQVSAKSEEDISINWSKVADFFKRYGILFIALIPIILSIYIRMQAGFLPFTDRWAADTVLNNIRSQIKAGIDQQYPNLPDANKNALVDTQIQKVLSANKNQIEQQITATSQYFKSFFLDENGKNYMPDIDPYYWYRYAKNIVEKGYPGDVLKDGKSFDNHQLAPVGRFVTDDMFHPYFLAYFYKVLHFFAPDLSLMRSMFYYPVFVSALCVLLVFLIGRKIAGNIGGFFAGMIMAVNAALLGRTLFGHADSDAWVVFFPLVVTWLFVETIDLKSTIKIVLLTVLAGFLTGLFTYAWTGWWYIHDFLIATIGLTLVYLILSNFSEIRRNVKFIFSNKTIRNLLIFGIVYFFSTAIFALLISGWDDYRSAFFGPLGFPSIKSPVIFNLWPNVLTTVAELNEGSINGIINSIGGTFLFYISLVGLIFAVSRENGFKRFDFFYSIIAITWYALYFFAGRIGISISAFGLYVWIFLPITVWIIISIYKKDTSYDFKLSILLSMWIISTIFASIKGIRFTLLLAPAFSVAFGVGLGKTYIYLSRLLNKEFKIHKAIASGILIVLLMLPYVNPIKEASNEAGNDLPIVNDAWYNALMAIKQNSSENAIITSWWDFGHHFKALADRPVTFDGTTQTYPPAHWVGQLLLASNETEAVGILRMLDCGSNSAFNTLNDINNDTHLSLKILNQIILLDKKSAEIRLKNYGFSKEQIEKVLSFTHCNPPEAYFIASEDMIGKSGVWSHFGSWNFERADIWFNVRKLPQEKAVEYMMSKFNYTKEKAENVYFEVQAITSDSEANTWVAPWPGYGGNVGCSKNKNNIYVCSNGLQVNLSNNDIFAYGQQGISRPKVAAFTTDDGIAKKNFNGSTIDFGATVIPKNENEVDLILSSKELAGGMFTRMFYMQGHGLRYFKLFNHQRGLTGTNIYVYRLDWEGKNATIVNEYADFFKPKAKEEKQENITEKLNAT